MIRRGRRLALALLLAPAAAASGAAPPQHIMSIMQCDDLMLLALAPKARIASISYTAHPAVAALMPGADRGVAINHGSAEEILAQKPDLIIASAYSSPIPRAMARRTGVRVVEIEPANSFAEIRNTTRRIGALIGASARAEAMIAHMDAVLADLAASPPPRPMRVAAWSGGGSVPGRGTLIDEAIRAAGGINIAATRADAGYGSFGIEELVAAHADAILAGEATFAGTSLHDAVAAHPIVNRLYRGRRIVYPAEVFSCGLPQAADAARALRDAFARLPPTKPSW